MASAGLKSAARAGKGMAEARDRAKADANGLRFDVITHYSFEAGGQERPALRNVGCARP